MVFGVAPKCTECNAAESPVWHKNEEEAVLCQTCFKQCSNKSSSISQEAKELKENYGEVENKDSNADLSQETPALSTRARKEGSEEHEDKEKETHRVSDKKESKKKSRKGKTHGKGNVPKGKGRRYIFKKSATKAPLAVSTPVTSDYLFYHGTYYQTGDVVSVIDVDGGTYYAQIRGLLQDQYCEKSAVLTWLIPTKSSPKPEEKFDPSTYIIGPDEDIPRKLEYMNFVCHAPSDYFKDRTSPYSTFSFQPHSCFVWSRMGPVIKPIEKAKELMTA